AAPRAIPARAPTRTVVRELPVREPAARMAAARPSRPPPARSAPAKPAPARAPQPKTTAQTSTGLIDPYEHPATPAASAAAAAPTAEDATAEGYIKMGRLFLQRSDFPKAAASFNRAREHDPRNPDAISGLGQISY